jgi:hypothetical protein
VVERVCDHPKVYEEMEARTRLRGTSTVLRFIPFDFQLSVVDASSLRSVWASQFPRPHPGHSSATSGIITAVRNPFNPIHCAANAAVRLLRGATCAAASPLAGHAGRYDRAARNHCRVGGRSAGGRLNARPQGLLRINIPGAFGRRPVVPRLPDFLAACPAIQVDAMPDRRDSGPDRQRY